MDTQRRYLVAFGAGLVLLGLVSVLIYVLLRNQNSASPEAMVAQPAMLGLDPLAAQDLGGQDVPTNMRRPMDSASQFYPKVDLHPRAVDIQAPPSQVTDPADRGNIVTNIQDAVQGQGVVPDVSVDGKKVPREVVKYGIFENHEFYPRTDQFPLRETPRLRDETSRPPKSHFGPMTYPLAGPIGMLGMDYMRAGSTDTRVNIASTGGRH